MPKRKLLIFHPTIAPYRIDYFNYLAKAYDTRICLQYWNLKDQTFDYQKIYDRFAFEPIYLPEGSIWSLCKAVRAQIKDFKPDIVLTCEYGAVTLVSLWHRILGKKKYKLVVMTDDSYDMVSEDEDFTARHRKARQLIAPWVDNVVVVSPQVEQWYQDRYKKGVWMPIIVDEKLAVPNYERLLPLSREYVIRYGLKGKKILLSVSRLVDLKNLHRVIDAFERVETEATLVIVGDGPERTALEEHAKKVEKEIIFTGRFDGDELYAWYNIANVFILASYKEPFGAVTNEALLAGCRVVISKKAGSSCLVTDDNGEQVDPMDEERIAAAIDRQMKMADMPNLNDARKNLMGVLFEERLMNLLRSL